MASPFNVLRNVTGISKRLKLPIKHHRRHAQSCTYVLLPEVPPDTAETNSLMKVETIPEWSSITPASVYRGCGKLAIQYETSLSDHCTQLEDLSVSRSFDDIFLPLEKITVPLQFAYKSVKHLSLVKNKIFADAFEGVYKHIHNTRDERWRSEILYNSIKELHANRESLSEEEKSLVDLYLREARNAGVELSGKAKEELIAHRTDLYKAQDDFRRRVYFGTQNFEETVFDNHAVSEMPRAVRNRLSLNEKHPEEGPWQFSVESANVYMPILSYCPDRRLRHKVWEALVNVGSTRGAGTDLSNKPAIDSIRYARSNIARLLGHNSYAEMAMNHKMAGNVDTVMGFLESLRSAFRPKALEELGELQQYANTNGFEGTLEMWDVNYWMRRQREELFSFHPTRASDYFSLPEVLTQFFSMAKDVFGIQIKQIKPGSVPTLHPSVLAFQAQNMDGEQKGVFFLDPYKRPNEKYGGCWVDPGRDRSKFCDVDPVSYVTMNIHPEVGKQPPLMSFTEALEFYTSMGHVLQQLMTSVDYSEISCQQNIEWDAVHISAYLMEHLFYDNLYKFRHWKSEEPLSENQVNSLLQGNQHMYSYKLMKKIFLGVYDLEMHISQTHWHTAMTRIWPRYMVHPLNKSYSEPCSMVEMFTDQRQAAGIYSLLWTEMVAADIHNGMVEDMNTSGKRFRDTFLSLGGSVPAAEVFRRFKGCDPSYNAFIADKLSDSETSSGA